MAEITLGPTKVSVPLTVSENSVIDFEAKQLLDLLDAFDLSSVSVISVRIENPNGGTVHAYTGSVTVAASGTFSITLTGSNHTVAGKGRGRVLFDAVTVPMSRFEIEWKDAF